MKVLILFLIFYLLVCRGFLGCLKCCLYLGVAMGIFITYILAKFTFNISLNVVKFALNVYDKLKL